MKKLLPRQFAVVLYELTAGKKGTDLEAAVSEFALFLRERQSMKLLPYITKEFNSYSKEQDGIRVGTMTTARELEAKEKKEVEKLLGEKAEMEINVDETLIGGAVLKLGNTILDGSIKAQLSKLRSQLIS